MSRILTCFAYNQPDLQFCPMLYSISSILRHFLSEEDTYGFLAIMAASKRSKYLFLSKLQLEVASVTAYELSKKYCVSIFFMSNHFLNVNWIHTC